MLVSECTCSRVRNAAAGGIVHVCVPHTHVRTCAQPPMCVDAPAGAHARMCVCVYCLHGNYVSAEYSMSMQYYCYVL